MLHRQSPYTKKSCKQGRASALRWLAIVSSLVLAACTVGPDYVRPTAPLPQAPAYKELAEGWKVAQPSEGAIRGAWWEAYGDPFLNQLEEQVVITNQNIAASEAQFRQARAIVQAARAGYFPTVSAGAAYTRSRQGQTDSTGRREGSFATNMSLTPVDATWELDLWGKVRRTVEANEASALASEADLAGVRLSAQAELAQDYFQLRTLDETKRLLDSTVTSYQDSLALTKNRYQSGVVSMADVAQAEAQLKTTQAQAIDTGVQRAQLEHAIAMLLGKPASDFSIPPAPLSTGLPTIPTGLPSELLERRPDIAAAERRVAAANAQIGAYEAAYYPTVTLSASGGLQSSLLNQLFSWPSRFWSVGPSVSQTVFDAGLRQAQTEQARAIYDQDVATYRQTVLTGFQEVEDNLSSLRILAEEAEAQDAAVQASQQSLDITTNQYKSGIVGYINVLTAQTTALTAQRSAVSILGNRMTASVLLIKALGGGWNASTLGTAQADADAARQ